MSPPLDKPAPPGQAPRNNDRAALLIIFLAALGLRLLYLHQISGQVFFHNLIVDQASYDEWAQRIAAGDWLGSEPFYQDPFYPYLLAVIYSIFGRHLTLVYALQALAASACVFAMYGIGRRYFDDRRAGLLAAAFWGLYKVDFFFAGQLEKTAPGLSLLILCLWLLMVFRDRPRVLTGLFAGLGAGTLLVFRGNLIAVMPVMAGWIVAEQFRRHGRLALPAAAALILAFMVTPGATAVRNYVVSGQLILTTAQGGVNFYVGNYRENEWGVGRDPRWARRVPRFEQADFEARAHALTGQHFTASELSRFWFREGLAEIAADPPGYLRRLGRKTLLILNWHEVSDNLNYGFFADHHSWLLGLPLPAFWLAGTVGFAGMVLAWSRRRGGWLGLFVALYSATLLAFYIVARYRLPMVVPLLLFAAYGLVAAVDAVRARDRRTLAVILVPALIFGALGCPNWQKRTDDVTWNNLGNAYAREQRWAEAIDSYQRAVAINPRLHPSWIGMGLAFQSTNRYDEAARAFEKAVEADPSRATGHYLLGIESERKGKLEAARQQFQDAVRLDPSFTDAAAALARVEAQLSSP